MSFVLILASAWSTFALARYARSLLVLKKRIKCHFERMIKVRSGCVRRQSDAKEETGEPSTCFFVNTVFQRLDSGDVKILNKVYEKTLHR